MKKFFVTIALSLALLRSQADEGMWLPMLLGQQVYNDMVKRGLKLTKDQLYHINKPSVKDAVIIFSGFCTGEIVSNEGLIFTNHHCGYDAIAKASTVTSNYLRDGFWATSKQAEIPSPGLYAEFLVKIEDVTKEVEDSAKGSSGTDRSAKVSAAMTVINKRYSDDSKKIIARTNALFKGNQYLVFVYQRYSDIRLAPHRSEALEFLCILHAI